MCVKGERLSGRVVRKREPVSLKCNEGLVNANNRREPVCLKYSEGPVTGGGRSSSDRTRPGYPSKVSRVVPPSGVPLYNP